VRLFAGFDGRSFLVSGAAVFSRLPRSRAGIPLFFAQHELFVPLQQFAEFVSIHRHEEIRLVIAPEALICCVDRPGYRARFILYRPKENILNPFKALKVSFRRSGVRRPTAQASDTRPGSQLGLF
jgi:hypothetical protein